MKFITDASERGDIVDLEVDYQAEIVEAPGATGVLVPDVGESRYVHTGRKSLSITFKEV